MERHTQRKFMNAPVMYRFAHLKSNEQMNGKVSALKLLEFVSNQN